MSGKKKLAQHKHTQNSPLISRVKLSKTWMFTNKLLAREILNIFDEYDVFTLIKVYLVSTASVFIVFL